MSESEKKQIKGVCEEISEKNGWVTFSISTGSQYPTRVSTKLEAVIAAGRAAKGQEAIWTFTQSQGGENPNKPGTFYQNRRLEKVEVGATLDPALAQTQAQARGPSGGSAGASRSPDERHSIERQTIVKAALPIYDQFADDEPFFAFMEKLATFVAGGTPTPVVVPPTKPAGDPGPTPPASEFPEDDDIPFVFFDNHAWDGIGSAGVTWKSRPSEKL